MSHAEKSASLVNVHREAGAAEMAHPELTVVVPFYNVGKYFRQCLESIAAQTFGDFEVLCIDDCGGDDSAGIAQEFAQKDARFRVIRHERNRGVGQARNTGIDAAAGKYISFIDSDDWILPEKFEKEHAAITETGLPWVCSLLRYFVDDSRFEEESGASARFAEQGFVTLDDAALDVLAGAMYDKLFRVSAIREGGVRCPDRARPEDLPFVFKFAVLHPDLFFVNAPLYVYRKRQGSHSDDILRGKGRCGELVEVFRDCFLFLREKNLLHRRGALYNVMRHHAVRYMRNRGYREELSTALRELLREMNYSENVERRYALDCILRYRRRWWLECIGAPLSFLNRLNPVKKWRRSARAWLEVNA